MMKCKKGLVAGVVAVCMMGAMGVNAFAADEDHKTTVKYDVTESYTWSVPTEIVFTTAQDTITTNGTTGKTADVQVTENIIAENMNLQITAKGDGTDSAFTIKNEAGTTLKYTVSAGNQDISKNNGIVMEVPSGTNAKTQSLTFKLTKTAENNNAEVPGKYEGKVIYTAGVVEADN